MTASLPLFIGTLGPWEIGLIVILVLLLFGGRKIPQLARDLGSGIKEFKNSISGSSGEIADNETDEDSADDDDKSSSGKKERKKG